MIGARSILKPIILTLIAGLCWSLTFIFVVASVQYAPATTTVFLTFVFAALFMSIFFGKQALKTARLIFPGTTEWLTIRSDAAVFAIATVSLTLTFFLQSIKRYSYAPSGSDSVFLLATTPLFVVLIVYFLKKEELSLGSLAGSVTALLGAVAIVGNWERPSSFSPFSMFRLEEFLLVLSAVSLAVFLIAIKKLTSKYSPPALVTAILWAVAMLMLMLAMGIDTPRVMFSVNPDGFSFFIAFGIFGIAVPIAMMSELVSSYNVTRASSAVALMPVLATFMIGIEKGFGISFLPTPFQWMPIFIGIVIVILGTVVMWSR